MIQEIGWQSGLRRSPLPLLLSGVGPFGVGTLLAPVNGYPLRLAVAGVATLGLILLILAAFWMGELYDLDDRQPVTATLPLDVPGWLRGAVSGATLKKMLGTAVAAATALGGVLQFCFHTGNLTIPLGGLGLLIGYAYSAPPLNWRHRVGGVLVAGFCFGWLPLIAGFYVQSGRWASELFLFGLPLSFSAVNIFLSQDFRDYPADREAAKHTLVVRWGLTAGALVYTLANIITIIGLVLCLWFPAAPLPYRHWLWVIIALAVINQEMVKRKQYRERIGQNRLQILTWLVNLGMGLLFMVMTWARL